MLTALIISYACSDLMHLTAMMSYDVCKRIQILWVHIVIQRACKYHQFLHCLMHMTSRRLHKDSNKSRTHDVMASISVINLYVLNLQINK